MGAAPGVEAGVQENASLSLNTDDTDQSFGSSLENKESFEKDELILVRRCLTPMLSYTSIEYTHIFITRTQTQIN